MNALTENLKFVESRRKGIGGSDLPCLLGIGFLTEYELWLDKNNKLDRKTTPELEEMFHFGHVVEPIVAAEFARRNNAAVQEWVETIEHKGCFLRGNVDRVITESEDTKLSFSGKRLKGAKAILEIKNVSSLAYSNNDEWGQEGTDEIPLKYWVQLQAYMGLAGVEYGYLAALIGGSKYVQYRVEFDAEVFSDFKKLVNNWWEDHMVKGVAPEPKNAADARLHYRAKKDKQFFLNDDLMDAMLSYAQAKNDEAENKKVLKELGDFLIPAFGNADAILSPDGVLLATFKESAGRKSIDWQACFNALAEKHSLSKEDIDSLVLQNTKAGAPVRVLRLSKGAKELTT